MHFEDRMYASEKKKRLPEDAIPTLNLKGAGETETPSCSSATASGLRTETFGELKCTM